MILPDTINAVQRERLLFPANNASGARWHSCSTPGAATPSWFDQHALAFIAINACGWALRVDSLNASSLRAARRRGQRHGLCGCYHHDQHRALPGDFEQHRRTRLGRFTVYNNPLTSKVSRNAERQATDCWHDQRLAAVARVFNAVGRSMDGQHRASAGSNYARTTPSLRRPSASDRIEGAEPTENGSARSTPSPSTTFGQHLRFVATPAQRSTPSQHAIQVSNARP